LDLDDAALAGHDEIGIGPGRRILDIVEVDDRYAAMDAAGDRRDVILQRALDRRHLARLHPAQAVVEGDKTSSDRGGAGSAIGLDDVAVDGDLELAELLQVDHGPERPADQALDFQRAAALLAGGRLPAHALARRARQHPVFGRDPALAAVAHPARNLLF